MYSISLLSTCSFLQVVASLEIKSGKRFSKTKWCNNLYAIIDSVGLRFERSCKKKEEYTPNWQLYSIVISLFFKSPTLLLFLLASFDYKLNMFLIGSGSFNACSQISIHTALHVHAGQNVLATTDISSSLRFSRLNRLRWSWVCMQNAVNQWCSDVNMNNA